MELMSTDEVADWFLDKGFSGAIAEAFRGEFSYDL